MMLDASPEAEQFRIPTTGSTDHSLWGAGDAGEMGMKKPSLERRETFDFFNITFLSIILLDTVHYCIK